MEIPKSSTPDPRPEGVRMSEAEVLEYAANTLKYPYPQTEYRTRHPDTVTPAEIAAMDPYEFSDYATAQSVIDDFRAIPRRRVH